MRIGLVGWGIETQSAFRYFGSEHDYVIVNEEPRDDFPSGDNIELHYFQEKREPGLVGNVDDLSYLDYISGCYQIIFQPAAHKNLEKKFPKDDSFWSKAKTIQHIFFENCPTKNTVGVTGSKGKGTTTMLIAKMLEADGKTVHVGGNIGYPTLDLLKNIGKDDWVVLELSSFQLYKFPYSPHIAVHLMMVHEHIEEWHGTMEDYVAAKRNIFAHQKENDFAIYLFTNPYTLDSMNYSIGTHVPYLVRPGAVIEDGAICIEDRRLLSTIDVLLPGRHNLENICAAVTAFWQVSQNPDAVRTALTSFSGLEHRLELAGVIHDVRYYDDSFGTTPDTAIVAMDAFRQPKVMIIGGHDKGNPFDQLAQRLTGDDIRHVIFIGTTGKKIYDMAMRAGFDTTKATIKEDGNSWTMAEIVQTARSHAISGDAVLLSTGCASFGLFKDYKDRGNQFKIAVASLGEPVQQSAPPVAL